MKPLDPTDIKILNLLQQNARLQVKQISERVYKSETPVGQRIRRMEEDGVILRYAAVLDRRKVGLPTLVITQVKLKTQAREALNAFAAAIEGLAEVQACLELAGEYDFLLQLVLPDVNAYEDFLSGKLGRFPQVDKVQSFFVLKDHKAQTALPLY